MALTCHGGGRETERKALLCVSVALWLTGLLFMSNSVPAPSFREAAEETGLRFRHFTGATGKFFMPEIMGPGAAVFDYDGDGDLDVYLLQGSLLDKTKKASETLFPPPEGFKPGNRLFRNELVPSGKLRFTDVTDKAGVGHEGYGMGVAVGDYDNDGDPDLYVTNFGHNVLYRNNGDGTFTDVTREAGVDDERWSASAAFLDYDRDGDLDLFVTNYVDFTLLGNKRCFAATGEPDYCTPAIYRPVPDRLFRNEGGGKFVDVTLTSGIGSAFGPGLGVVCADFNLDGWTDIYVANDGAANLLWINKGNGTFEEAGLLSGAAYGSDGIARAGMGVTAGAVRNEGEGKKLVETSAGPAFQLSEVSRGAAFGDIDNDGDIDIVVSNNNGPARLLLNETGAQKPWLEVRLQGVKDNRSGLGARLALRRKGQKPLWRRAHADGSYLSANDCRVHFGLGGTPEIEALEIYWPCGDRELWTGIRAGTIVTLRQGTGKKID